MNIKVDLDTKTFFRFWAVIAIIVFAVFFVSVASTAFYILGLSLFLALALNAPVSAIARLLPGKGRVLPTAIAYVLVTVVVSLLIFFIIPPIINETINFLKTVPTLVNNFINEWKGLNSLIEQYNLRPQIENALDGLQGSVVSWAGSLGSVLLSSIGSILNYGTQAILVFALTFLMLVEGPSWKKRLLSLYGNQKKMERQSRVLTKMSGVVSGYVNGQILLSAIGGLLSSLAVFGLSFLFPAVPASLAIPAAVIAFILSLIPVFGAFVGGIIVAAFLFFSSPVAALIYLIYFTIYQQIENNALAPKIQAKKVNLSALTVLAAVTIGIYTLGVAGAIIAIPIAGCIRVLVDEYAMEALARRKTKQNEAAA